MNASMNFGISSTYIEIFSKAKASGGKIFALLDTVPIINQSINKGKKLKSMTGNIEFRNVTFHYPTRKNVPVSAIPYHLLRITTRAILILKVLILVFQILTGLDMKINSGETVALVGSSGCGKSTCIQMLQRFYDPIAGKVRDD